MQGYMRSSFRRELDEAILPLRLARKPKGKGKKGWVQSVREATGIPVEEMARRMGVKRWEVRRLELAEGRLRIQLGTLQRAAEGLGCELVYGLIPKEGTLEDLAAEQEKIHALALAEKREARQAAKQVYLDFIGWRPMMMKALRAYLRREGYRVRPAETDRNVERQIDKFLVNIKALKLAGMLGGFMKEFMEEQEEAKKERENGDGNGDFQD